MDCRNPFDRGKFPVAHTLRPAHAVRYVSTGRLRAEDKYAPASALTVTRAVRADQAVLVVFVVGYLISLLGRSTPGTTSASKGPRHRRAVLCPVLCWWGRSPSEATACVRVDRSVEFAAGNTAYINDVQYLDPMPYPSVAESATSGHTRSSSPVCRSGSRRSRRAQDRGVARRTGRNARTLLPSARLSCCTPHSSNCRATRGPWFRGRDPVADLR